MTKRIDDTKLRDIAGGANPNFRRDVQEDPAGPAQDASSGGTAGMGHDTAGSGSGSTQGIAQK
jgi:hypothetical protein